MIAAAPKPSKATVRLRLLRARQPVAPDRGLGKARAHKNTDRTESAEPAHQPKGTGAKLISAGYERLSKIRGAAGPNTGRPETAATTRDYLDSAARSLGCKGICLQSRHTFPRPFDTGSRWDRSM